MTVREVNDLLAYWREAPPAHESLAVLARFRPAGGAPGAAAAPAPQPFRISTREEVMQAAASLRGG